MAGDSAAVYSTMNFLPRLAVILALLLSAMPASAATEYVEGEVIVTFKPTAPLETAQAVLKKKSLSFATRFGPLSEKRKRQTGLVSERGKTTAQLIAEIKDDPTVETVEPNYLRWVNAEPNDPRFAELWALKNTGQAVNGTSGTASADVKFVAARELARTPLSQIVVGVIDSGMDVVHPDLAANVWVNNLETPGNGIDDDGNGYIDDRNGYDFASGDADPSDSGYHGTHVAGTIGARGDNQTGIIGVNERVRLLALKVSTDGTTISTSAAISALQYATALKNRGVNIVALNASYGGGGYSSSENAAIQAAGDAGIILCAAAGNNTSNNDSTASYPASYRLPNMIVVAATDQNDGLASYSNYGATTVDIAAPGSNILSTQPSTVSFQAGGTTYSSSELTFSGLTTGVSGNIVDCGFGNSPAEFPAAVNGHIALIQRGTQTFSTKVTYAMAAGAKAAIIWNNVSGTFSGTLQTANNWIPARSISQADGQAIRAALPRTGAIVVTGNYQYLNGTSMATPHVAGAVAFAAMNFPGQTVAQRRQRILASVDLKLGLLGKVATSGRLNLLRIVDADANGVADWQPVIATTTLPLAIHGEPYLQSLAATGGSAPYVWTTAGGSLPPGFILSGAGIVSGTSSVTGAYVFTARVTDALGATATQVLTLNTAAFGPLDHFTWDYVPDTAYAGSRFAVRITGRDSGGRTVTTAGDPVNLTSTDGAASALPLSPTSVSLTAGSFAGYLTIGAPAANVMVTATQSAITGTSGSFTVNSGTSSANDGIPDSWKTAYGLSLVANIASLDSDGDGMTNRQEYAAGTNPNSPASVLKIATLSTDASTQFTLSFPGIAGRLYQVSTSDDLGSWITLPPSILAPTTGIQTVSITLSGESAAFFRVEIVP